MNAITACHVEGGWVVIDHENGHKNMFALSAVASWSELLGVLCPVEVVQLIDAVDQSGSGATEDPVTRQSLWTDLYTLVGYRERQREVSAWEAVREGTECDPRSPGLRSYGAAWRSVHQPIDGGECALNRCRTDAMRRLGLAFSGVRRHAASRVSPRMSEADIPDDESNDHRMIREAIGPHSDDLYRLTRRFLHRLAAGEALDPLAEDGDARASTVPDDPIDVLKRLGAPNAYYDE